MPGSSKEKTQPIRSRDFLESLGFSAGVGLIARALFVSTATFMFVAAAVILPSMLYLALLLAMAAYFVTSGSFFGIGIFVAALIGCVVLIGVTIGGLVKTLNRPANVLPGVQIGLDEEPQLRSMILHLCSIMNTSTPDVVVLSAEPVFAVFQGRVRTVTGTGQGRILILGAPCLPNLTVNELRAILAHEFAHFTGLDAWYSAIIIPIQRGLRTMVRELKSRLSKPASALGVEVGKAALIAPYWMLGFYDNVVSRSESKLADAMEVRADCYAASTCGTASFANGLMKVAKVSAAYADSVQHCATHSKRGSPDWYTLFRRFCSGDPEVIDVRSCPAGVLERLRMLPNVNDQYLDQACSLEMLSGFDKWTHALVDILALAQPIPRSVPSKASDIGKYATFGARVTAFLIDYMVLGIATGGLALAATLVVKAVGGLYLPHEVGSLGPFLTLLTAWLYFATAESRSGATVGKRALKISVIHVNGARISFLRATARLMAKLLHIPSFGITMLMIFFDDRRQVLHDKWCSTVVIKDTGDAVYPMASDAKRAKRHFEKAVTLQTRKEVDAALREAREAVRLNPNDGAYHAILGFALYSAGDYRGALDELVKGKDFADSTAAFGHKNTGTITRELIGAAGMKLGEYGEAVEQFHTVLQRNPNSTFALFRLGVALQRLHQDRDALQYLLKAVSLEPTNAAFKGELAHLQYRLGDTQGALEQLKEVECLDPARAGELRNRLSKQ